MLSRLAPLALLLFAACHRTPRITPGMASSTLIGSWHQEWAEADSKGVRFTQTFASDGTWTYTATALGNPMAASSTWMVFEDHPDRVTVRIAGFAKKDEFFDQTFVFESSDRMRDTDGSSDAAWFTRVKVPK